MAHRSSPVARPLAPPGAWTAALLEAVSARLPLYCGQSTSLVLVALARLGVVPDQAWASAVVRHLTSAGTRGVGPQVRVGVGVGWGVWVWA